MLQVTKKNIVKEDSDSEDGGSSSEQAKSDELDLEPVIDANPVEDSCIYKMGDHVEWTSYMDEYSQLDFCLEDVKTDNLVFGERIWRKHTGNCRKIYEGRRERESFK